MGDLAKIAIGLAIATASFSSTARADVTLIVGNNPNPGQQSVQFIDQGSSTSIVGYGSSNPLDSLTLTGTTTTGDTFIVTSGAVKPESGLIESLTITPSSPLDFLILNTANGSGLLTLNVVTNDGSFAFLMALANGQNFWTLDAINGESIESVTLSAANGFGDVRQFAAIFVPATASVPEPATWAMMLLGFGGVGFAIRRQKKAAPELAKVA